MHYITRRIIEFLTRKRTNMLKFQHKLTQLLSIGLLGASTFAYAATNSDEDATAYVDSVYGWGAWELGLEPAAGGPVPVSNRALTTRAPRVSFRPNENSTLAPDVLTVPITRPGTPGDTMPTGVPDR